MLLFKNLRELLRRTGVDKVQWQSSGDLFSNDFSLLIFLFFTSFVSFASQRSFTGVDCDDVEVLLM